MSEGRPGSGQSHHTTSSERTGASGAGGAGGAARGAVVQLAGQPAAAATVDGDRYKLMFTGPDGLRDHSVRRMDGEFTGTGERSFERTGNLGYMFRTPRDVPFPRGKHGRLGEIGGEIELWGIKKGI